MDPAGRCKPEVPLFCPHVCRAGQKALTAGKGAGGAQHPCSGDPGVWATLRQLWPRGQGLEEQRGCFLVPGPSAEAVLRGLFGAAGLQQGRACWPANHELVSYEMLSNPC